MSDDLTKVEKIITRFAFNGVDFLAHHEGDLVRYSDHAAAITAKDAEIERLREERDEARRLANWQREGNELGMGDERIIDAWPPDYK